MKPRFDRSQPGVWVSGVAHAALIAAGLVAFAGETFPDAQEGIPVEVITENQFSEITKGEKTASEVKPEPKPRAERVAEKVEEKDPGEAARDVPSPPKRPAEMKTDETAVAAAAPPPPPPPPARPEPEKPEPKKPEPPKRDDLAKLIEREEAEVRAAEAKAKAESEKAKQAAEAKAAADAKVKAEAEAERQQKTAEEKAKKAEAKRVADLKAKADAEARAKKQAELAEKFDPNGIADLLKSKDPAQSTGSSGREIQKTASLGTATGTSQRLSPSMLDSLRGLLGEQIRNCYAAPPGATASGVVEPALSIQLKADGSLAAEPRIVSAGPKPVDRSVAEAALRAVRRCAPYRVPAQFAPYYDDWKNINATFGLSQA